MVGPLVEDLRDAFGLSSAAVGLVTTLPLVAFAAVSPIAAPLARRFGTSRVLVLAMIVLTAGLLARSTGSLAMLYVGTALVGTGIAAGNVLVPAAVRRAFPGGGGGMTAAYVTVMVAVGGLAATLAVPLADDAGLGWEGALACWAAFSVLALLAWLPALRREDVRPATTVAASRPWRSRLAWTITAYMGLQSLLFYALIAWLPEILREDGSSARTGGLMLGLLQLVSLAATIGVPILAGRRREQGGLVAAGCALCLVGFGGLLAFGADGAFLWSVLLGLGTGATFALGLTLFILRAADEAGTAALSGMAQSVGYAIAAIGPTALGALRDATGSWAAPLAVLLVATVAAWVAGLPGARDRLVT